MVRIHLCLPNINENSRLRVKSGGCFFVPKTAGQGMPILRKDQLYDGPAVRWGLPLRNHEHPAKAGSQVRYRASRMLVSMSHVRCRDSVLRGMALQAPGWRCVCLITNRVRAGGSCPACLCLSANASCQQNAATGNSTGMSGVHCL